MKKYLLNSLVMAGVLGLSTAYAVPTLRVSLDNSTWVTISDGSLAPLDANPTVGAVTYINTTFGNWSFTVNTGVSKPASGSAASPSMHLNVIATSTGAGSLYVEFNDTDFNPIVSPGSFLMTYGGTSAGTALNETWVDGDKDGAGADTGNNGFAAGNPNLDIKIGSISGTGAFASTQSAAGTTPVSAPYSITLRTVFTHTGAGTSSSDNDIKIPEGGNTILLLGSAFGVLALVARSRKFSRA